MSEVIVQLPASDQLGSNKAIWNEVSVLEKVKQMFVKSEARLNNRIARDHPLGIASLETSVACLARVYDLERVLRCKDFVRNVFKVEVCVSNLG